MIDAPATTEKAANYHARAGQTIAGNLARGGDGKFASAGSASPSKKAPAQSYGAKRTAAAAKLRQRLAARAAAKPKGKGGKGKAKPKAAAKPKSTSAAERRAEMLKRQAERKAEQARRKVEQAAKRAAAEAKRSVAAQERADKKAARQAEIAKRRIEAAAKRAARAAQAKGGGGGKGGKSPAKAKPSAIAQRELEREKNRAKVQAETLDADAFAALISLAGGEQPDPPGPATDRLVAAGLVERDVKGGYRVSQAGRAYTTAAERGDVGRAKDAMSRAADRVAKPAAGPGKDPPVRQAKKEVAPSLAIFKQADGRYRWVAVSSTAFRDRDQEIVSVKALQDDCEVADATGQYGPLRFWHLPRIDIGDCDYNAVVGRSLIESGTFRDPRIGAALAAKSADWRMSIGFVHPHDQPTAEGVFTSIRRFERSIVPAGRESNTFTRLVVKDTTMDQTQKLTALKSLLNDDDLLATLLGGVAQTEKEADAQGVAYKAAGDESEGGEEMMDDETEDDGMLLSDGELDAIADRVVAKLQPLLNVATKEVALNPEQAAQIQAVAQTASQSAEQTARLKEADEARAKEIATLKERLSALEGEQPKAAGYRASESTATVTNKEASAPQDGAAFDPGFLNFLTGQTA